jgi:uroporphyrinogen-III synthase
MWRTHAPACAPVQVRVAVVGGGTGEVLQQGGCPIAFTPSKALGKALGAELPRVPGGTDVVLYPASSKASNDLQDSLAASGLTVKRLNTYNTVRQEATTVPVTLRRGS